MFYTLLKDYNDLFILNNFHNCPLSIFLSSFSNKEPKKKWKIKCVRKKFWKLLLRCEFKVAPHRCTEMEILRSRNSERMIHYYRAIFYSCDNSNHANAADRMLSSVIVRLRAFFFFIICFVSRVKKKKRIHRVSTFGISSKFFSCLRTAIG